MLVKSFSDSESLATTAANQAADIIRDAIKKQGSARVILATGNSQLPFLDALTKANGIDWTKVEAFHLDEYVGIPITHPASFRNLLLERFVRKTGTGKFHCVEADAADLNAAIRDVGRKISSAPVDVGFIGIGENGHIAFNDPPANFETEDPYLVVELDEACRKQQVGEGWFPDIAKVPKRAISMSPRQIMKARAIVSVVPDQRKANAVKMCLEGEISPMAPGSLLRRHPNVTVYLDRQSASMLGDTLRAALEKDSQVTIH
jgi:glucosamine-6-phosphate deaminase